MRYSSIVIFVLFILLYFSATAIGQTSFIKKWDFRYGGNKNDLLNTFFQTSDKGYLLAGATLSDSGFEIHEHSRGGIDCLIIRTDSAGQILWGKRFGGSNNEFFYCGLQLPDGGFVFGGYTDSPLSGDVSQWPFGNSDFWLVRTDSSGIKLWDKRFGGTGLECIKSIIQTPDCGFLLGGTSDSDSSGNIQAFNHGHDDFLVIKTDSTGNNQWIKLYGGTDYDEFKSSIQSSDGNYILAGETPSDSTGDVSHHTKGNNDFWILKIDTAGNKIWDYVYGGDQFETVAALIETSDNGYLISGITNSGISYDVTEFSRGLGDYWIVKTDSSGIKLWDHRFGGSNDEDFAGNLQQTMDGGYLFCGTSYTDSSFEKTENNLGKEQGWLIKTDSIGNLLWDKTIFTATFTDDEVSFALEVNENNYVVANYTDGIIGGYKSQYNYGSSDLWLLNIIDTTGLTSNFPTAGFYAGDTVLCEKNFISFFDTSQNANSWSWTFPGAIPDTSTSQNPIGIFYPNYGFYPVTLTVSNFLGTDSLVVSSYIHVVPSPSPPIISIHADTLVSGGALTYQWYFNAQIIPGATDSFFVFTQQGSYFLVITDSNGCRNSSTILNTGFEEVKFSENEFIVFPNPNNSEFELTFRNTVISALISIVDISGRKIRELPVNFTNHVKFCTAFEPGVYLITLTTEKEKFSKKLIVLNHY